MEPGYRSARIEEIDIIKALGILCVAAGHAAAPFARFLYLFHMAVFFIASGFCFKSRSASSLRNLLLTIVKKLRQIWLPFFIWNSIFALLNNFFIRINVYTAQAALEEYVQGKYIHPHKFMTAAAIWKVIKRGFFFREGTQIGGAFWFLRTLFMVQILYYVVEFLLQKTVKAHTDLAQAAVSAILLGVGYYCSLQRLYVNGFGKTASFYCLFYLGHVLAGHKSRLARLSWKHFLPAGGISFLCLVFLWTKGAISFAQLRYVNPGFMLISSLCGWVMLYSAAYFLRQVVSVKQLLLEIGKRTISVVLFHFLAFKLVAAVVVLYYGLPAFCIAAFPTLYGEKGLWWLAYTVAGTGVPIAADIFYHRLLDRWKALLPKPHDA